MGHKAIVIKLFSPNNSFFCYNKVADIGSEVLSLVLVIRFDKNLLSSAHNLAGSPVGSPRHPNAPQHKLYLQMMSPVHDGNAQMLDFST